MNSIADHEVPALLAHVLGLLHRPGVQRWLATDEGQNWISGIKGDLVDADPVALQMLDDWASDWTAQQGTGHGLTPQRRAA